MNAAEAQALAAKFSVPYMEVGRQNKLVSQETEQASQRADVMIKVVNLPCFQRYISFFFFFSFMLLFRSQP